MEDLKGLGVSVIGAGVSGFGIALLAKKHGADVFVSDNNSISEERKKAFLENGIKFEENGNSGKVLDCDFIVVSSGISPYTAILKAAEEKNIKVIGELDFVYPYLKGKIIAITGSNGKTTTTSLTTYLLEKSGFKTIAAGNIGLAISELADKEFDYIVMELSSFQLYWANNFKVDSAVITNLAPDHINWHGSYENYVESKAKLFKECAKDSTKCICQLYDTEAIGVSSESAVTLSWEKQERGIFMDEQRGCAWLADSGENIKLFDFTQTNLLGKHNMENIAMSLSAIRLVGAKADLNSLKEYKAPGHRCSFVGEINGITFIDDSKGTNVAAAVTAMSSLPNRKVIILGGQGKGEDYSPLCEAVKKYADFALLIGEEREKIAEALRKYGYSDFAFVTDMKEAVEKAYEAASAGKTVLLSPACTSWDMYSNYGERGDDFAFNALEIIKRESDADRKED